MTSPEEFLAEFCHAIIIHDYHTAEQLLAPWIRAAMPAGGMKKIVRLARGDAPTPVEFEIGPPEDDDPASIQDHMPEQDEVTDDNFRGAYRLDFFPEEELGTDVVASYVFYVAVVEEDGELKIGYLETTE